MHHPWTAAQARSAGADEMWAGLILLFRTEPSDLLSRTSRLYPNRARQSQSNVRVAPPHGAPGPASRVAAHGGQEGRAHHGRYRQAIHHPMVAASSAPANRGAPRPNGGSELGRGAVPPRDRAGPRRAHASRRPASAECKRKTIGRVRKNSTPA